MRPLKKRLEIAASKFGDSGHPACEGVKSRTTESLPVQGNYIVLASTLTRTKNNKFDVCTHSSIGRTECSIKNKFSHSLQRKIASVMLAITMIFTFSNCDKLRNNLDLSNLPCKAVTIADYLLESSGCSWNFANMAADSVYVINSNQELMKFITGSSPPSIDFTNNSLLLVHGTAYGSIAHIDKKLVHILNEYKLSVEIRLGDTTKGKDWHIAVTIPKIQSAVELKLFYPHVEVWECRFEGFGHGADPDLVITLTLDTLLSRFYTSSIPEDIYPLIAPFYVFFIGGGIEGKYLIEEDTMRFDGYWVDDFNPYNRSFTKTMYNSDSMLLHHKPVHTSFDFPIYDYLFIKQN